METSEKIGYLKGLMDGLELDESKKETKIFRAIIDVLDNMNMDFDDMFEAVELVGEQIDEVNEAVMDLEDIVYDDDCDCDCCDCDDEMEEFEVNCPTCGAEITIDEETIMEGKFECPNCGEVLEFDFDCDCDDDDCHCCD